MAAEESLGTFNCGYCNRPIREGQHYIRLAFALDTAGLAHILREPSLIAGVEFDTPACAALGVARFMEECLDDRRVQDTWTG